MSIIKTHKSIEELYVVSNVVQGALVRHVKLSFRSWCLQSHEDLGIMVVELAYEMGTVQNSGWISPGYASFSDSNQEREFLVDPSLSLAECVKGVFLGDLHCHMMYDTRQEAERDAAIYRRIRA